VATKISFVWLTYQASEAAVTSEIKKCAYFATNANLVFKLFQLLSIHSLFDHVSAYTQYQLRSNTSAIV